MRAIVFLCLLHAVFHETSVTGNPYSWGGGRNTDTVSEECVADKSGCGCCLMKTNMDRVKQFFTFNTEKLTKCLNKTKTVINHMRDSQSAFSVSLTEMQSIICLGPFANDIVIIYKHVFLNWENGYNINTGIFTAPCSGVYSFAVTIYSTHSTGKTESACANLQVNNVNTELVENQKGDAEDSNTVVLAVKLKAGDEVAVSLRQGCIICDDKNHYNTFTGFLVYATGETS